MQNVPGLFTAWRAAEIGWALFFELQLDDGPVRFTSSVRNLSYGGQTWLGDGTLLGINFAEVRLSELGGSFEVTLSGVVGPEAVANGLLDRLGKDLRGVRLQNREARAFMAKVSRDGTVSDVIEQASGTVDTFTRSLSPVVDGEEAIITLNLERGALLGRGLKPRRLDLATHQEITPGSTALRQASELPKLEGVAGKSKLKRQQKRIVAADNSVSAFSHVLGRTLIEGEEVHRELSQDAGGNKDRWYYQVRVLSCSPVTAIRKIWVGDEEVPITTEDERPEDGFTAPSGHRLHKKVRFKFHLGGDLGGDDPMHQKWGNPGANDDFSPFPVVQILLSFEIPGGIPEVRFEVDGAPLPDLRDPAQDPADPSTWVYSRNPIVQAAWFVQQGFAFAEDPSRIDIEHYQTYADVSDGLVSRGPVGGTEPRYTSGLVISEDAEPSESLQEILASCRGDFVEPLGGIGWIFYAAAWAPPVVALGQTDILEGERTYSPQSIDEGERFTLVRGKFRDAENRFVELSAPAATSPDIKAQEWGDLAQWLADNPTASDAARRAAADQYRDFETEISVDACGSVTQMQRLQWIVLEASRRGALYEASFGIAAATLPPGVRITLTDADNGIVAHTFRVIARQIENLEEEPGVTLTLVEDDEEVYALPVLRPRNPSDTDMSFPVFPSGRGSLPGIESVRITDWGTRIQFSPHYFADPAGFRAILHAGLYLEAYLTTQSGLDAQGIINDALNSGLHGEAPQGANVMIDGVQPETTYYYLLRLMDRSDGVIDYGASLSGSYATGMEIPLNEGPAIVFTPETNEVGVITGPGTTVGPSGGVEPLLSSNGLGINEFQEIELRYDRDDLDTDGSGALVVRTSNGIERSPDGLRVPERGIVPAMLDAAVAGSGLQQAATGVLELRTAQEFNISELGVLQLLATTGLERTSSGVGIAENGVGPRELDDSIVGSSLSRDEAGALDVDPAAVTQIIQDSGIIPVGGDGLANLTNEFRTPGRRWNFVDGVDGWTGHTPNAVNVALATSETNGWGGGLAVTHPNPVLDPQIRSPDFSEETVNAGVYPLVLVSIVPTTAPGAGGVAPVLFWNENNDNGFDVDSRVVGLVNRPYALGEETLIAYDLRTAQNWAVDQVHSYNQIRLDISYAESGGVPFNFRVNWVHILG